MQSCKLGRQSVIASFGLPGDDKPTRCSDHRGDDPNVVNLKWKPCLVCQEVWTNHRTVFCAPCRGWHEGTAEKTLVAAMKTYFEEHGLEWSRAEVRLDQRLPDATACASLLAAARAVKRVPSG